MVIAQLRRRDNQIIVLRGLALRPAEVIAQRAGEVPHLGDDAEFPARDVIHQHPRRQDVVAQIAATFVQYCLHYADQCCRGHIPGHQVRRGARRLPGDGLHIEQRRFLVPVEHQCQDYGHIQADDTSQHPANDAGEAGGGAKIRIIQVIHGLFLGKVVGSGILAG